SSSGMGPAGPMVGGSTIQEQYSLSGNVSWEPDVWGRIRRSVESDEASLEASRADKAATRLSLQSALVQNYFRLRALDDEIRLMDKTVAAYERSLRTTRNQFDAGIAPPADVAAATTQLENARGQRQGLGWQRTQLVHALAVL